MSNNPLTVSPVTISTLLIEVVRSTLLAGKFTHMGI